MYCVAIGFSTGRFAWTASAIRKVAPALLTLAAISAAAQENKAPPLIRDVTPSGVVRVYRSPEDNKDSEAGLPKLPNVRVLANGKLRSGQKTIQLYGIALPERKRLCFSASGARWACGVAAFVALRNLVEARAVACHILDDGAENVVGQCQVDRKDISIWLLQNGWADVASDVNDKPYVEAIALAKSNAVGLWANGPPASSDANAKRR